MSFADAERRATLACFSNQAIAFDVLYQPVTGAAVETTVIIEDESFLTGDAPVQAAETRTMGRLLVSKVPSPRRGDRLVLIDSGAAYTIENEIRHNDLDATYVLVPA